MDGTMAMALSARDRHILRRVLAGASAWTLATELGMSPDRVSKRIKELFGQILEQPKPRPRLPVVPHPRLASLLHLWNTRRDRLRLPRHGALRLTDLQPWIEHIAVVELAERPPQPKVRLMGRKLIDYMHGDNTGRCIVDCVPPDALGLVMAPLMDCVTQQRPQYDVLRPAVPGWTHLTYHRLMLPHASDGHYVDIVMVAVFVEGAENDTELPAGFYTLKPRKTV